MSKMVSQRALRVLFVARKPRAQPDGGTGVKSGGLPPPQAASGGFSREILL